MTTDPPTRGDTPVRAVEVRGLVARYGERTVLDGIDLDVERGHVHVIMGGSGSGKSVLLRHMLGLEPPQAGSIKLLGQELSRLRPRQLAELRRKIGVAFQSGALLSSLTVGENVMLPLRELTRLDEQTMRIVMRMKLEYANLRGCEDLMPAELSGGMVKRAALARAIVMDPQLLFLDEPTSGLDPAVAANLDELMMRLRDEAGMTLVVVSHDLQSAFKIADRLSILQRGRIAVTGTVAEVKASADEHVQSLLQRRVEHLELDPQAYLHRLTERQRGLG